MPTLPRFLTILIATIAVSVIIILNPFSEANDDFSHFTFDAVYLKDQNSINITFNHLKFRDHFNFDQKAILKINKKAQNTIVLTTEKDYGRLSPLLKSDNLFYIPVKLSFFSKKEETEFNKRVKSFS